MRRRGTPSNLVLTGFMGTGKSTVGRLVADELGYELVDTDAAIESAHGPIETIFAEGGEPEFRRLEHGLAVELGAREGLVIATGGGMLLDPANVEALGRTGLVICLVASPEEVLARVHSPGTPTRPLLAGPDPAARIRTLLAERAIVYGQFEQLPTDGRSPESVADEVVRRWERARS